MTKTGFKPIPSSKLVGRMVDGVPKGTRSYIKAKTRELEQQKPKKIRLKIVKTIPKKWKTKNGPIMPFFPLNEKAIYHMVEQDTGNRIETHLTYQTKDMKDEDRNLSILMYKELIDNLKNGGTILVDETVLEIKDL